jgi:hypothetical protein
VTERPFPEVAFEARFDLPLLRRIHRKETLPIYGALLLIGMLLGAASRSGLESATCGCSPG